MPRIGIFDSGVGGLTVAMAIRARMPAADLLYVADSAHAPYGPRPVAWIRGRSNALVGWLVDAGSDAVVVACNTATAAAADSLRERWALPIVAMEPAVKPAAAATRRGVVAVFATDGTLASRRFATLLERYASGTRVVVEPCGDLVAFAEAGDWDSDAVVAATRRHLDAILAAGADTLVLGCTHFPLLTPLLERLAGDRLTVIDTGDAVARELVRRLGGPTASSAEAPGGIELFTSGEPAHLEGIARRLLPVAGPARRLPLAVSPAAPEDTG